MNEKDKQLFLGLYQMILSDMEVHPKELELLYRIGKQKGVSKQDIQQAIFSPANPSETQILSDDDKIEYLFDLAQMAQADEVIDDREKDCLQQACKRLGFEEKYIVEITDFLLEQARENKSIEEVLRKIKTL
jgi:uncharacterized tellurite resistance protein B-like protein